MSQSDDTVEVSTASPVPSGVATSPFGQWLLIDANRWLLAGILTAVVFVVVVALGWLDVISVTAVDSTTLLLSVLVGGNATLVTIVISINQLVLSREFGKPHSLTQRDDGVRRLREQVTEVADVDHVQPEPIAFLALLAETMETHADRIGDAAAATDDHYRGRVAVFRQRVEASTDQLQRTLDVAEFGSFGVLSGMLTVNSAWLIANTIRLRDDRPEDVPAEPFDRQEETLRLFNVTRQYTKTLYVQKEIAALSRLLLYVGFSSLLVLSLAMLTYGSAVLPALSPLARILWFGAVMAAAFAPIAFLLSYMLRLSAVVSFAPLRNPFITDG